MRTCMLAILLMGCLALLAEEPFLKQTKKVAGHLEWNREIVSRKGGTIRFRVTSSERFGVTLVTDSAHKDLLKGVKRRYGTNDMLLTIDCQPPAFERTIKLGPGSYHFILENQSSKPVEFTLECYEAKQ